ncbi:ion channel protein [Microlunatus elymi]|uniref:Ion channel protein n=1 Tax=Microlunatus elymi TaxID=2596828 RepID=A0A516Q585_9ACTN|nr:ion channel protein [Microlunatus elymi]
MTTGRLAKLAIPAAVIGVLSGVSLALVSWVANQLQHWLWDVLPQGLEHGGDTWWWIIAVLTATGLAVGAVVQWAAGHAGNDPAATELVAPPLPMRTLPGLIAALILGLAGGVSLGPENPIIAVNVALSVWLVSVVKVGVPKPATTLMAASGTIGAMFGTPVGAALLMTELVAGKGKGPLFDRLFGPLVAAGTGSLTMTLIGMPQLSVSVPKYTSPAWVDLISAPAVAIVAALLCLLGVWAFRYVHSAFHRMRYPILMLGLGGLLLGILGAIGGPLTLFKGLDEMQELTKHAADYSVLALFGFAVIKLAALVLAACAGFRGGRIFPSVFIGVAVGLAAHALIPSLPLGLTLAAAVTGAAMVVARDGWLALFMGVAMVGDVQVLPVLCLVVLPLWLLVRSRPLMLIENEGPATS